ncbi:MAG: glycosyltransferase family 4 protein [Lentisphaeria bacterium]
MRILLTIPKFYPKAGGAETFALLICRGLTERGHEVHVATQAGETFDGYAPHIVDSLEDITAIKDEIKPDISLDWGLNTKADVHRLGGGVHKAFLKYKFLAIPWFLRPLKVVETRIHPKHRRLIESEGEILSEPETKYIAVSHFVKEQLQNTATIDDSNIRVLPNGVDVARFKPAGDTAALRRQLGVSDSDVLCLFVAHNLRLKNFALLRRVFHRIHRHIPELKLVLLGKRSPRIRADWFVYAGAVDDPAPYYQAADIMLHPTFYDACANTVLEALAGGCAVISSDLNGSAEILASGLNGFVLPVTKRNAVEQWSGLLGWLAQDHKTRRQIGKAATDLAAKHEISNYIDHLEGILKEFSGTY